MTYNFDFLPVPKKEIILERIETFSNDDKAKRIHFATTNVNSLKTPTEKV